MPSKGTISVCVLWAEELRAPSIKIIMSQSGPEADAEYARWYRDFPQTRFMSPDFGQHGGLLRAISNGGTQ